MQAGVGDPVSGDHGVQVHGNNHHIPSQHHEQSVYMEQDTTLSVQVSSCSVQFWTLLLKIL